MYKKQWMHRCLPVRLALSLLDENKRHFCVPRRNSNPIGLPTIGCVMPWTFIAPSNGNMAG